MGLCRREVAAAAARQKQLKPVATIERSHLHSSLSQKSLELSFDGELGKRAPEPEPEPAPPGLQRAEVTGDVDISQID